MRFQSRFLFYFTAGIMHHLVTHANTARFNGNFKFALLNQTEMIWLQAMRPSLSVTDARI